MEKKNIRRFESLKDMMFQQVELSKNDSNNENQTNVYYCFAYQININNLRHIYNFWSDN